MTIIRAPFTSEQVDALNRYQSESGMHPFTCGGKHPFSSPVLAVSHSGWYCADPSCTYTQDWAHAFMTRPEAWPGPAFTATGHTTGCRSSQHCANWGWCNRCAPRLAKAIQPVLKAAKAAGLDPGRSGHVYGRIMAILGEANGDLPNTPGHAKCPQCGDTGACAGGPCPLLSQITGRLNTRAAELEGMSGSDYDEWAVAARELRTQATELHCPDGTITEAEPDRIPAPGASRIVQPDAGNAIRTLAEDLRYVLDHHGPGHAHLEPGHWDGDKSPCGHCARLEQARQHLAVLGGQDNNGETS